MEYEKRKRFIVNLVYGGMILLVVYIIIQYGLGLLTPFLAAFIIASLLVKPAKLISKKTKLPYKPVVLALVLLFYCTVGLLAVLLLVKLALSSAAAISTLPEVYNSQIEPTLASFFNRIEQILYRMDPVMVSTLNDMFNQFVQSLGELLTDISVKAVGQASGYAASLPKFFVEILLMIISTFFIAIDYDRITSFALRQFSGKAGELLLRIKAYVVGTLFVCIRSYALIMSITFVELSVGLTLIGVENAVPIALLISIFDILPVLGTGGIMIPWVVITAVQQNYPLAVGLLAVYLFITVVRNVLEPKIVGSQLGLHPIVTLMSMFVGVQLFGVVGLFGFPILLSLLKHLSDTGTIKLFK